jgi:hypothetical protein
MGSGAGQEVPVHVRSDSGSTGVRSEVEAGLVIKTGAASGVLDGREHRHEQIRVEGLGCQERRNVRLRDHDHMGPSGGVWVVKRHHPVIVVEPIDGQVAGEHVVAIPVSTHGAIVARRRVRQRSARQTVEKRGAGCR